MDVYFQISGFFLGVGLNNESATATVKRGNVNLVILKVVSSLLVRLNLYIANQ